MTERVFLFNQWFRSKKLDQTFFSNLPQLFLLEEFKDCVPQHLKTHLEDKNVKTLEEAQSYLMRSLSLSQKYFFPIRSKNNHYS